MYLTIIIHNEKAVLRVISVISYSVYLRCCIYVPSYFIKWIKLICRHCPQRVASNSGAKCAFGGLPSSSQKHYMIFRNLLKWNRKLIPFGYLSHFDKYEILFLHFHSLCSMLYLLYMYVNSANKLN